MQGANCFEVCIYKFCLVAIQGSTAQFGKKSQTGFLPQFKVWKTKESCMYFWFFKRKKWGKKTAETRRRNCAVLPQQKCNNLSFANSRCGGFELRFCHVWEKCTASAQYSSNLGNKAVPCWDTFSVPRYLFSLIRMRRPTTTSYRPTLPAAIMLRASLRFWDFIAVLHLRELEIPTFQIHGGFLCQCPAAIYPDCCG